MSTLWFIIQNSWMYITLLITVVTNIIILNYLSMLLKIFIFWKTSLNFCVLIIEHHDYAPFLWGWQLTIPFMSLRPLYGVILLLFQERGLLCEVHCSWESGFEESNWRKYTSERWMVRGHVADHKLCATESRSVLWVRL